jgi:hypothetical protein
MNEIMKDTNKMRAFVVMCFDSKLTHIFSRVIKPALEDFDIEVIRGDNIDSPGTIIDQIDDAIKSSDIIIGDLTYLNPNVFYELGIAHSLEKPTILITQQTVDFPFDTRHMRTITYTDTNIGLLELKETLSRFISTIAKRQKSTDIKSVSIFQVSSDEIERQKYFLTSVSPEIKRYAIRFLGDCKEKSAYDKICTLVHTEKNDEIVRDAISALYNIDPEKALDVLIYAGLTHQPSYLVRERVVSILSNYEPDERLIKQINDQSDDSSWGVRRAICLTLAKWNSKETKYILDKLRDDPEIEVRLAAYDALEKYIQLNKSKSNLETLPNSDSQ